jgi:hypothetical protein
LLLKTRCVSTPLAIESSFSFQRVLPIRPGTQAARNRAVGFSSVTVAMPTICLMKWVVIIAVGVCVLAALSAAYVEGGLPGSDGCVLRSVDGEDSVRRNEEILRTLPLPSELRRAQINTWSYGVPATNQCIPTENGPPYSYFITAEVFHSQPQPGVRPIALDVRVLGPRWVRQAHGVNEQTFCNGDAWLNVDPSSDGFRLSVDHRGCERIAEARTESSSAPYR